MVLHDLTVACRSLLRRPTLSASVVLTLALGVGATATVYSVVDGVVLRPLPYTNADRLATLGTLAGAARGIDPKTGLQELAPMTSVDLDAIREQARFFEAITAVGSDRIRVSDANGVDDFVQGASVAEGYFDMVGVSPVLGRSFLPEEFEFSEELAETFGNAAVITHGYWQRRYGGDPQILGQPLELAGSGEATALVVGILPEGYRPPEPFFAPDEVPEIYTPMRLPPPPTGDGIVRVIGGLRALALLRPSVSFDEARAEVARIAEEMDSPYPPSAGAADAGDRSLGVNGLSAETVGTTESTLWIFLGAATLLLLLATLNAASLLLARALDRRQELGVRTALGASRGSIVRLLLYEAGVLTAAGTVLGVLVAIFGVEAFHRFAPRSIPRLADVAVDGRVVTFAVAASVVAGVTAGLLPAWRLTRRSPWERLREGGRSMSEPGLGLRSVLVSGQLALAVVLLAGAGLLFNSFVRLRTADPGFDPDGLVVASGVPAEGIRIQIGDVASFWTRWDPVVAELDAVPGVSAAAGASDLPFETPRWFPRVLLPGDDADVVREGVAGYVVTPGYFAAAGTEVMRGRGFEPGDGPTGERVVVVNEAFVRAHMGGMDPQNTILRRATEGLGATGELVSMRVVGVVQNVVQARVEDGARPAIYVPYGQADLQQLLTWSQVVRSDLPTATIVPEVRRALTGLDYIPEGLETMPDRLSVARTTPRFQAVLVGAFSGMAVLLAGLGLYGALAERVRRLSREVGIRMMLGADAPTVVRLVAGRGLRLTAVGLLVGLVGTAGLSRVLEAFLYGVEPLDPLTLLGVALVLAAVGGVASWVPARRATRLDPVRVLNAE